MCLLDDAQFDGGGDMVAVYLKSFDGPDAGQLRLEKSIGEWVDWGKGRDRHLTQAYGDRSWSNGFLVK